MLNISNSLIPLWLTDCCHFSVAEGEEEEDEDGEEEDFDEEEDDEEDEEEVEGEEDDDEVSGEDEVTKKTCRILFVWEESRYIVFKFNLNLFAR